MSVIIVSAIIVLIVFVALVAGAAIMWWAANFFNLFARKNDTHSSTLLSAIRTANEMIVLHSNFERVVTNEQTAAWLSKSKALITCKGRIVASFDMLEASINVIEETKLASIIMPQCKFETIIPLKDVKVYDATRGVYDYLADFFRDEPTYSFNKLRDIVEKEEPELLQEVLKSLDLEKQAKDNARIILKNLAATFGYTADIAFKDDSSSPSAPKALGASSTASIHVEEALEESKAR
ncbi:MAG: DUF4230 domain-containing protein [Synergistaceae bacterium]|nr:DUF4230 domain-containing protein [Synergistaceae bacterium]